MQTIQDPKKKKDVLVSMRKFFQKYIYIYKKTTLPNFFTPKLTGEN